MPVYLTPGQALLKLIKHYKNDSENVAKLDAYKRLYLTGAIYTDSSLAICSALLDEEILKNYELTINEYHISEEPSRRYFETHLAYHTFKNNLGKVSLANLEEFLNQIQHEVVPHLNPMQVHEINTINATFAGQCPNPSFHMKSNRQYNNFFEKILNKKIFADFSDLDQHKAYWIFAAIYAMQVCGWGKIDSPISAYTTNPLFVDKGKRKVCEEDKVPIMQTRNQNYGLLKGHMPIFDANDIALAEQPFKHWKASDFSNLNDDSPSTQILMQSLIHPYSNGISGVGLIFMKVLAYMNANNLQNRYNTSNEGMNTFLQLSLSLCLYNSGGHSLFEYLLVLAMPEVAANMRFIEDFDSISFESVFYDGNEDAFNKALDATLEYTEKLEQRHSLLKEVSMFNKTASLKNTNRCSPDSVATSHINHRFSVCRFNNIS